MQNRSSHNERQLEVMLVLITLAMASVLYTIETSQVVILNLFFLPVIMAGFFLGRYRAGILAFLSVIVATIVVANDVTRFSFNQTPVMVILSIMIWGAVLGMAAILVGTLCDDRNARALEAHEAHVGVVEVLARYLQSADSRLHAQTMRIVQLCEGVAQRLKLSHRDVDDLRVAAMLMDVENIEITARVIRKAVGNIDDEDLSPATIHGTELAQSLRNVLSGAAPLILSQAQSGELPVAARVLKAVRTFVELESVSRPDECGAEFALDVMRQDPMADEMVLSVLEVVIDEPEQGTAPQSINARPTQLAMLN